MAKSLESLPGVTNVKVDFSSKTAKVTYEKGKFDPKLALPALEKAGFEGEIQ